MKRFAVVLATLVSVMCQAEPKETDSAIADAGNIFAFNLLRDLALKGNPDADYVVISPLSASMALSMAANGAEGNTFDEMSRVLASDPQSKAALNKYYRAATRLLFSADPAVKMNIANSIWINNHLSVKCGYLREVRKYYDARASKLDFSDSRSVDAINNWCSDKTEGRIDEIIERIDPSMMMFIINALYFKGEWTIPFDKNQTVTKMFSNANNNVSNVDMMSLTTECPYFSNSDFSMIELDYGNGSYAMDIILPNEGKSTKEVIQGLSSAKFKKWVEEMETPEVNIHLPKFRLEYETFLNDPLCRLGMPEAFTSSADFSAMSKDPLMIGVVKQKTFIEVNEEGSEAAAVTVIGMVKSSFNPERPKMFHVNRPFIFAIREKTTGIILFLGEVNNLRN